MKKKVLGILLVVAMTLQNGTGIVMAEVTNEQPPAPGTSESEDYQGDVIDYPDKNLWFDTTVYGGFMNAYEIVKNNGDDTFDIDSFINSELGELTFERIKDELCVLGDNQWGSDTVINQWKEKGIIEEIHNPEDEKNVYLTFVSDYMMEDGNEEKYPLVIDYHGGGGSLFESIDHGFVHISYDNKFIVACPEVDGTKTAYAEENLESLIDELVEQGYPVDESRIYLVGHSMGGIASLYGSLLHSDKIAAIGISGCSGYFGTTMNFDTSLTEEMYSNANPVPMYLQIGTCDNNQWPFKEDVLNGVNSWLKLDGCKEAIASDDNILGFEADEVYEEQIDGTTYTFGDFNDEAGNNMVKFAAVEGLPHWVSPSYSAIAWEFMKSYSRSEDGTLLKDGNPV